MGRSPRAFVSHGACRRLQDGHRQSGMKKNITLHYTTLHDITLHYSVCVCACAHLISLCIYIHIWYNIYAYHLYISIYIYHTHYIYIYIQMLLAQFPGKACRITWSNHGWWLSHLPLWKIMEWVRQLGWLFHSQYDGKVWESQSKFHGSSHHQPVIFSHY